MHSEQLTISEITTIIVLAVLTLVLWLLKDTPLGFLWKAYKWFWLILFAVLMANYVKKEIKDWWKK